MASTLINFAFGILPEAIYFTLFLIFTKELKEKRILFLFLMLIEYLFLSCIIKYNILLQLIYTFMTFVILKVLYREKAIITDIFVFALSSIILIAISAISYMAVFYTIGNYIVAYIIQRIMLFVTLFALKNKLNGWYRKFNSLWNRRPNAKIRSLTIRNITIIIFNLMFYIINFGMIYFNLYLKK